MKRLLCLLVMVTLLCGCTQKKPVETDFWAMDTYMNFKLWGTDAVAATEEIKQLVIDLEKTWSPTDDTSFLAQLNRGVAEPAAQQQILNKAMALSMRTDGAFNPQLNCLISLWGFLSEAPYLPEQAQIENALAQKQWNLGAVLKGYAGQEAVDLLESRDVSSAILNLGGNIQTYGQKADGTPWRIAIQNPLGGEPVGIVSVAGTASVVTSGDYQRYFEQDGVRYHHILDPKTGYPANSGLSSVTVICRDGTTADALSTALFVMGLEQGADFWRQSDDFDAVWILSTGKIYATEDVNISGCEYEVISRED